jgi:hypothetical protein
MNRLNKFDNLKLTALSIGLGSLLLLSGCTETKTPDAPASPGSTPAGTSSPGSPPPSTSSGGSPVTVGLDGSDRDGSDPVQLIQSEQVKKELGLTDEQIGKIKSMESELRAKLAAKEASLQLKGLDPKAKEEKLKTAAKEIDDLTKESRAQAGQILKPEQIKRMKEIMLQIYGWSVLTRNDYKDELKLTDAQNKQLDTIQEQMGQQMRAGWQIPSGEKAAETTSGNRKRMEQIMKTSNTQALAVLTPAQKTQLETLKGKKFEFAPPKAEK